MSDELLNQARENVSERDDGEWGYRVVLEPDSGFVGRWRGQTVRSGDYGDQPVYLFWDADGALCFIYGGRVVLDRKIETASPSEGDSVAVMRGEDEFSNGRTLHRFGVAVEPNPDPLPETPEVGEPDW